MPHQAVNGLRYVPNKNRRSVVTVGSEVRFLPERAHPSVKPRLQNRRFTKYLALGTPTCCGPTTSVRNRDRPIPDTQKC
jgi:hypothetical protein